MSTGSQTPENLASNPDYQACCEAVRQCVDDCRAEGFQAADVGAINWADLATKLKALFQQYGPIVIRILAELGLLSPGEPHFGAGNPESAKPPKG